jgi:hypothetical protein
MRGQKVTLPIRARWSACRKTYRLGYDLGAPDNPACEPRTRPPGRSRYTRAVLSLGGWPPEPVVSLSALRPSRKREGPPGTGPFTIAHTPSPARAWVPLSLSERYSGIAGTVWSASLLPGAVAVSPDGRGATPVRRSAASVFAWRAFARGRIVLGIPAEPLRSVCPGGAVVRVSSRQSRASRCTNRASRRQNFTQAVSPYGRLPLRDQSSSLLSAQSGSTGGGAASGSAPLAGGDGSPTHRRKAVLASCHPFSFPLLSNPEL